MMIKSPKLISHNRIFGSIFQIRKDPIVFGCQVALENPPLVEVKLPIGSVYYTADATIAHEILVKSAERTNRGENYRLLEIFAGKGLFSSEGDVWKHQRKIMQPAMTHDHYSLYIEIIKKLAYKVNADWDRLVGKEFNMSDEMSLFTIRAISLSLFSVDITDKNPDFIDDLFLLMRFINLRYYDFVRLPIWLPIPAHINYRKKLKKIRKTIEDCIDERRNSINAPGDMLDLLINGTEPNTDKPLPNSLIRDEMLTLITAGFKTSSAVLSWIWYQLDKNPHVRNKLVQEHESVIGENEVEVSHLSQLTYTRCVINEALRMCPSAFAVPRNFNQDVNEFVGLKVTPGKRVITSIFGIHYNPQYWENPEKFIPERFIDKEKEFKRNHTFIPFGAGMRSCLGSEFAMIEMLIFLAINVRKYAPVCKPGYKPKMIAAIAIQFVDEMPMILKKA
jgi:cytochrome P450